MNPADDVSKLEKVFLHFFGAYPRTVKEGTSRAQMVQQLRPIERGVIWRGGLAGFLSGLAAAGSIYVAEIYSGLLANHFGLDEQWVFYTLSIGLTAVATFLEVAFLYVDGVKGCAQMSQLVQHNINFKKDDLPFFNGALVRAGLEIPSTHHPLFGIDPLTERSKLRLLFFSVVYKLKVSLTNVFAKFLIRRFFPRLAGRTFGRALIELASAPVFAIWNVFLCRRIMRQARVRAMGPALVAEMVQTFFPAGLAAATPKELTAAFCAIRETVELSGVFHCNLILLASLICEHLTGVTQNDPQDLATAGAALPQEQHQHVMNFFALALVLDGKINGKKEKLFLRQQEALGLKPNAAPLVHYIHVVRQGLPMDAAAC